MDDAAAALAAMPPRHEAYVREARRLQRAYAGRLHILVGFEAEFVRPACAARVQALARAPPVDYVVGSVHHVHGRAIDYDAAAYAAARAASCPPDDDGLAAAYYDAQRDMLLATRPRVVGHFDLIRLLAADAARDPAACTPVWERIRRNLRIAADQGALLECNTAALRKGLAEPYPCRAIAKEWLAMGGRFTMSDDSHAIAHVATNYARGVAYLESLGVEHVWTLRRHPHPGPAHADDADAEAALDDVAVPLSDFKAALRLA